MIIFPEGTRPPVDAPPDYKTGVGQIYANSGVPCIPVALNSGLFWPRRTFMRYPGTLVVEFLDPLPPGLKRQDFIAQISSVDRGRHQPAGRGRASGAGAIVRPGAELGGEGVGCYLTLPWSGRVLKPKLSFTIVLGGFVVIVMTAIEFDDEMGRWT